MSMINENEHLIGILPAWSGKGGLTPEQYDALAKESTLLYVKEKIDLLGEVSEDEIRSWFGKQPKPVYPIIVDGIMQTNAQINDSGYMMLNITVDENGIATFNS